MNFEFGQDEGDFVVDLTAVAWVRDEVVDRKCRSPKRGTWSAKTILFKKDLQNSRLHLKMVGSTLVLPYYHALT
jgi:hypothetical protein